MATTKKDKAQELSVEEKLQHLYELQKIDTAIDKIRTLRGELPLEVQDLEDEIAGDSFLLKFDFQFLEFHFFIQGVILAVVADVIQLFAVFFYQFFRFGDFLFFLGNILVGLADFCFQIFQTGFQTGNFVLQVLYFEG